MSQFIFSKTPLKFWLTISIIPPGDGAEEQRLRAQFVEIDRSRFDEIAGGQVADSEFLSEVLIDWDDVVDEHGAAVPFTAERARRMANTPWMVTPVVSAYIKALTGLDLGNSER